MPRTVSDYFDANNKNLNDVFKRCLDTQFVVPRYQRQYTWDKSNIGDFWSDLKSTDMLFFGTFLFTLHADKPHIDIVDGQQRITTVTIFVALIRNILVEHSSRPDIPSDKKALMKKFANKIRETYIWKEDIDPETRRPYNKYYIKHNQDGFRELFKNKIQTISKEHKILRHLKRDKFPTDSSRWNIVENYNELKKLIDEDEDFQEAVSNHKQYEYFFDLIERFKKFQCVEIDIEDEALAYEYFDAVNARGKELSISNLLRNLYLKNLSTEYRQSAQSEWDAIERKIEETKGASVDQFFNYYWCAKKEYISGGGKKLYRAIKSGTEDYTESEWETDLIEIGVYCDHYVNLIGGSRTDFNIQPHQQSKKFFSSVKGLRTMKNKTWMVFMMNYLFNKAKYKEKGIKPDTVSRLLEYFVFNYFTVLGLGGNKFFLLMHKYCKEFNDEIYADSSSTVFQAKLQEFINEIRDLRPDDKDKYIERASDRITYDSGNPLAKYVLKKIEKEVLNTGVLPHDDEIEAEHILPLKSKSKWKIDPKTDIKPPKTYNMIGNLTLLEWDKNRECDDNLFSFKKSIYKTSVFNLAKDLESNNKWKNFNLKGKDNAQKIQDTIISRSKFLSSYIYKHWVTDFYKNL